MAPADRGSGEMAEQSGPEFLPPGQPSPEPAERPVQPAGPQGPARFCQCCGQPLPPQGGPRVQQAQRWAPPPSGPAPVQQSSAPVPTWQRVVGAFFLGACLVIELVMVRLIIDDLTYTADKFDGLGASIGAMGMVVVGVPTVLWGCWWRWPKQGLFWSALGVSAALAAWLSSLFV